VREKWVGLALPLADGDRAPVDAFTSGVLSGPRNRILALLWGLLGRLQLQSGYAVYASEALATLEKTAPDAASWWRANVPQLQGRSRKFLFQKAVCETVDAIYDGRQIGK
jgi:hypothetical protein